MPLYTYKCTACGHEFDELVKFDDRDANQACKLCQKESERKVGTTFGIATKIDHKRDVIYSPKEIDKVVGEASEKKWEGYDQRWSKKYADRQAKRWEGKETKNVIVKSDSGSPVMQLGNAKEKSVRKEFSSALKEHRAKRVEKGLGQFTGSGAIVE